VKRRGSEKDARDGQAEPFSRRSLIHSLLAEKDADSAFVSVKYLPAAAMISSGVIFFSA
jgi:hypothetical protein